MEKKHSVFKYSTVPVQIALWTMMAVIILLLWTATDFSVGNILGWAIPLAVWILVFYINYLWLVKKMLNRNRKPFFIVNALLLTVIIGYLTASLLHNISKWGINMKPSSVMMSVAGILLILFSICFFIFAAVALRYIGHAQQLEHQQLIQQQELARMETEQLKAQLNPHFLFNSLNNISSLAAINPEMAQESLATLSDMMRHILAEGSREFVPLDSELEFIRGYVALMRLRYTDSLKVDMELPARNTAGRKIPPMLLISLIENAFKHGAASGYDCFIRIRASIEERPDGAATFRFATENSLLPAGAKTPPGHGVGLRNLRRRLDIHFPNAYLLSGGPEGDIFRALLIIPLSGSND